MDKQVALKPRMSEKTYGLSVTNNTYTFEVPMGTNKHSVAKAVEAQFGVTVVEVNIMKVKGKSKRTVRKGGRAVAGKRSDTRKAYVKLKAGDKLSIFDAIEEANESAAKADKKETK